MNESHESVADLAAERRQHSKHVRIERIGALIAQGYTLSAIAGKRGLPNIETVRHWFAESESLREAYEQARDLRNELLADAAVALADTRGDDSPASLKLRIDARKWRVALDRKDEAKGETSAAKKARIKEETDQLVRMLERSKKCEAETRKRDRAKLAVELAEQYGFTLDQETIDAANPYRGRSCTVNDESPSDAA